MKGLMLGRDYIPLPDPDEWLVLRIKEQEEILRKLREELKRRREQPKRPRK